MMVAPTTKKQRDTMAQFLYDAVGVMPHIDTRFIGWVADNRLKMVVALDSFIGKTCQIHAAMSEDYSYTPRDITATAFGLAFNHLKREFVFAIVNSLNLRSMRYCRHIGFRVVTRIPGVHVDGGDVVMFGMWKQECRYIEREERHERTAIH